MWGRVWEGTVRFAQHSASFQSLLLLPTSKLGPSSADSLVGELVYILGPCCSLQWTLLWDWEFLPLPQPPQIFSVRGFEALFPCAGTLGCKVCLAPQLFLPVYLHSALLGVLSAWLSSPPLLLVWTSVSSLTPWLLDFHAVRFSVSSGCFLFLNLLLSLFWLYEEAQCVYLCLHLGRKETNILKHLVSILLLSFLF